MPDISRDNLTFWVNELCGLRHGTQNPEALEACALKIEGWLAGFGLSVERQDVPFKGRSYRNLIATCPGSDPSLPMLLLGAHYDGPPGSPGADDNASGVAVMLETARLLAATTPRRTMKFVAFTLEEPQGFIRFLLGSEHYAKQARAAGEKYQVALILESVGYCNASPGSQHIPPLVRVTGAERGDFLGVVGNHRSRHLASDFARIASERTPQLKTLAYAAPPLIGRLVLELRLSDHASFWDQGYPALMLTDTAMMRNPHYHCSTDTPETISIDFMAGVADAVCNVMREWAGRKE